MSKDFDKGLRLFIEVPDGFRQFCHMIERRGHLYIAFPKGEGYEEPLANYGQPSTIFRNNDKAAEERTSLHPRRETGGHAIVKHHYRSQINKSESRRYTHAPHSEEKYCVFFSRRCIDFGPIRAENQFGEIREDVINIGSYNPKKYSLFYILYWSSDSNCHLSGSGSDFSVAEFKFGGFRIGIAWSFIAGFSQYSFTNRMKSYSEYYKGISPNDQTCDVDAAELIAVFKALRLEAHHELFERIKDSDPSNDVLEIFRDIDPYFRSGDGSLLEFFEKVGSKRSKDVRFLSS